MDYRKLSEAGQKQIPSGVRILRQQQLVQEHDAQKIESEEPNVGQVIFNSSWILRAHSRGLFFFFFFFFSIKLEI